MDWPQRKQYKSGQKSMTQKPASSDLHTPPRPPTQTSPQQPTNPQFPRSTPKPQCPYHFSHPSHICLTCRKTICLRCAITYCQQHTIYKQQEILPLLIVDLQKLTIQPRIQDIQLRLKQSQQRQEYLCKKIQKIMKQVEENFQTVKKMLEKKKEQILEYFKEELQHKFISEYHKYNQQLLSKLQWLKSLYENSAISTKIEQLDSLSNIIKKQIPSTEAMSKVQLKISKLIAGKDRLKISNIWSQERLEQILYEIQHVHYKIKEKDKEKQENWSGNVGSNKKKRVITEISDYPKGDKDKGVTMFNLYGNATGNHSNSNSKNPFAGMVNSGSNSRFSTGRKLQH